MSKSYVSPLFITLWINGWHPPAGECQKSTEGAKKFRLDSLAILHPPDQNFETAPAIDFRFFVKSNGPVKRKVL